MSSKNVYFLCFILAKKKTFSLSLRCPAPPVGRAFGTVNTSVSEDSAVISWEYFGHHKNVYVEYIVENSKAFSCISKHQCMS